MKQLLLTLAICGVLSGKSQTQTVTPVVMSNQGGYSSLSGGSISWSVGEPVSESYTAPNNITTMGFHQPELAILTLVAEQGANQNILVFPNPVKDVLNVNFTGLNSGNYKVELVDDLGKLIYKEETEINSTNQTYKLKVNEVAAGNYFLRVEGKEFNKAIKIVKVN